MYIVGTSGHIDHGKTSLIMSLTGVDCDRLPEEKEREMTIDIGFASIEYPKFGTVSIIDVPGHERFIRNMVAGAWGIDLALLVIAVDDGWMPQTEDHFRVLELLGVERIIVVINKIDLADDEMVDIVEQEVKERLQGSGYEDADIVKVSSKTGEGVESLKEKILDNLRKLARIVDSQKPYLFADRVFASKGYGTVVTGTLKNGIFHDDDIVKILPGGKEARIKRIESHHSELHEGSPSQRTALNLSGLSIDDLKRGSIVVKNNFFQESGDIIASIRLLDKKKEIKNNLGIEVLIGTSDIKGKLILLDGIDSAGGRFPARIKFDAKWFFYPGQPFVLTNPGGYRILGGGVVLDPAYSTHRKAMVRKSLNLFNDFSRNEIIEFVIAVRKWIQKEEVLSIFPGSSKAIDKALVILKDKGSIREVGPYIVAREFYKSTQEGITQAIEKNTGLNVREISDMVHVYPDICKILLTEITTAHAIVEKDGRYFSGEAITIETLPAEKKKVLDSLLKNSGDGIELDKIRDDIMKKEVKELIKLNFLVSLDGNIIYHRDIYEDMKNSIMKLFETHDKISVADARDSVGLSRKYIIPLLNRIERDGLVKRVGDFRIKS